MTTDAAATAAVYAAATGAAAAADTACFDGVWWEGYQRECPARLDTKNCALRCTMHVMSCIVLFVQFATSVVYPPNPHDFHLKPHRPNIPWTLSHGSTANASMNVTSCYDQTATLMRTTVVPKNSRIKLFLGG